MKYWSGAEQTPARDLHLLLVGEVTDLNPYQRIFLDVGVVFTQVRAAQPGPGRVASQFIAELAADNVDLLAAEVAVPLEALAGGPAHQRYLLAAMLVQ